MSPPPHLLSTLIWLLRTSLLGLSALAMLGLVLMALVLEWVGQHNLTTAFLMYLPGWIWALPLACLTPLLLLFKVRYGLSAFFLVVIYWGPWLGYGFIGTKNDLAAPAEFRLLSWNRGQAGGQSLQPFKNRVRPDVIALQDAAGRQAGYQNTPEYAELAHVAGEGEFLVLSRFPVRSSEGLSYPVEPGNTASDMVTVAARFELESPSGPLALYNVHLPTPRDTLSFYRRGVFLLGILGIPGTEWGRKRAEYQRYWDGILALNRQLANRIATEKLPVLVAGDFNSPAFGPAHRLFTQLLKDCHQEGGRGYGHTFPGQTGNPIALFRPWLRLDRILAGKDWDLVCQETEFGRSSQHLAIFAAYKRLQ